MKTIPTEVVKRTAAKYLKIVQWSAEDKCFVGLCPGLFYAGCHGKNEFAVYKELTAIVEEHVESLLRAKEALPAATAGRSYSGKFVVRVTPELHEAAALKAEARGESLNKLVADAIAVA